MAALLFMPLWKWKKIEPTNCDVSQVHRLCVCASGSLIIVILNSSTLISVSCLHFGQNNGRFVNVVSARTFNRVLDLHIGQYIHFVSFCIAHYLKCCDIM